MRVPSAVLVVLSCCSLVAGCALGSYGAEGIGGGYSDAQVDRTTFRVTYKGNATMKQADTDELALLHAAEVARQHGFAYFVSSGSAAIGSGYAVAAGTLRSPASTLTIVCFPYRPETTAVVYESDLVIATLGPKYRHD